MLFYKLCLVLNGFNTFKFAEEDVHVEMNLKLIMVVVDDQPEVDLVCFLRVGCNTLLGFKPLSF